MAILLTGTTIGGHSAIHAGNLATHGIVTTSNIGSYAITSIPTSFSSITVTSSFDTASNDVYASMRVIRNNSSTYQDGMYIGYGNSGSGITRIFGGGSTGGALEKYATYTVEPGSFRAPIFYDSADTTYYFNGDSITSLRTRGSWRADSADWDGEYSGKIQYHSNHWYFQSGNMWFFRNAGGGNVFQVDQSGNATFSGTISASNLSGTNTGDQTNISGNSATTSQRSFDYIYATSYLESAGAVYGTIFYDNNDRNYYVDPNGMSKQVQLTNLGTYGSNAANARNHFVQYNAGNAGIAGGWIAAAVYGHSGANRPNLTYDYGVALSYGEATGPRMQMYFPENSPNLGTIFRKATYRTGWNGNWSTWKTLVEQEENTCTIVGGNGTGLEVHGNVGYNQDPLTYFLLRGQADTSWKALKIRLTGDAGGQDIEFRRIAENGADARMFYVPRGANQVIFEYQFVQGSDSRLKDNIIPITNSLDKVKSLRGVEFDWNSGEQVGTHDVGLIAQEVEAVLPEAVTTQEDGYKNLAYTKVIPLLVEAMKEQQAMIEALRAEIELLKNK